jgi:hypothetical protein
LQSRKKIKKDVNNIFPTKKSGANNSVYFEKKDIFFVKLILKKPVA